MPLLVGNNDNNENHTKNNIGYDGRTIQISIAQVSVPISRTTLTMATKNICYLEAEKC